VPGSQLGPVIAAQLPGRYRRRGASEDVCCAARSAC